VYRNGGFGIGIVGSGRGSPNARVYTNTIVGSTSFGVIIGTTATASPNASVDNNIIQDNDVGSPSVNIKVITRPQSDVGYDGNHNVVSPATYAPPRIAGPHDLTSPVDFVDAPAGDFHVLEGSDVINQGGTLIVDDTLIQRLRSRTVVVNGTGDSGVLD